MTKAKEPAPTAPESNKNNYKKIALIVGHGSGDSGAEAWNGSNEFSYNSVVANLLKEKLKEKEIKIFWRGSSGITGVNTQARIWDDDLSIELHCNSFNGAAKGCEVLTLEGDQRSIKIGQSFADSFCKKFQRVKRNVDGVKELEKGDRGHYSLALVSDPPPSILVEPFFIDNVNEWIEPVVYADFLVDWINSL